jgi:capsular polysaccharide biosynthesis protein
MNDLIRVAVVLAVLVGGLLALAPRVSESLVRSRARRLPPTLSARMCEEWLAELGALPGRASQLAFAIALTLTRRHSFAIDDESLFAGPTRSPLTVASFGGWPSVVVFTTVVVAAIASAASFLIPPVYRSHARVILRPQSIPARFVAPAARGTIDERVRAFRSIVLSHRNLEETILKFDLYKSDRGLRTGERDNDSAIERMRRDISVEVHADGQSFEVAYASTDPQMALMVTERLTSLILRTYRQERDISRSAVQFLDGQITDVRSRLLQRTGTTGPSPSNESHGDVRALEHESLKATYRDLLLKKEQAMLWVGMEARQIGEQFLVVNAARLPDAPVSPDRTRLTLLGAVIGFCLGIALMMAGRGGSFRRPKKMLART